MLKLNSSSFLIKIANESKKKNTANESVIWFKNLNALLECNYFEVVLLKKSFQHLRYSLLL